MRLRSWRLAAGMRFLAVFAAGSLGACGGGGTTSARAPAASSSWIATLRYNPTELRLSLSSPVLQYMYIDSGATNGVYPSPGAFAAELQAANPGLLSGACSMLAQMTATTMQLTDSHGVQAPSYVVSFAPRSTGACTQQIDLGAAGTQSFSVTVTP
jgi:hypothetical protein